MSGDPVGYVFGYATIADADDPLVVRGASDRIPVYGHVRGYRRVWNAAVDNRAPTADHKHYIDPETGERPDVAVVSLNIELDADTAVNGVAVPVDAAMLALFDHREHFLDRVDVTTCFTGGDGMPVWAYTANPESLALYATASADDRAVIRRVYYDRVLRTFRELGREQWADFERSTTPPSCPIVDLEIVRAPGDAGL